MSKQNNRNNRPQGKAPTGDFMAWTGFNMENPTYAIEDIYREPTKRRAQELSNKYIPFFTDDNWALDNFFAIVENSPTTQAIIKQKTEYSMGDGFIAVPSSVNEVLPLIRELRKKDIDPLSAEALNDFAKNVNTQGDTLEEVTRAVFNEMYSFGNAFVLLKMFTAGGKRIATIENLPIYLCRPKKADKGELYPKYIGFSEDFEEHINSVNPSNVKDYPIFPNIETDEDDPSIQHTIIHLKVKKPNFAYWGMPDWSASKLWGELEYRIPKFNQSMFENGFAPSAIISLFGATNSEEARNLINGLKDCFTGTGNNSKMFVQALRDETQKAQVDVLNNSYEGQFLDMQRMAFEAIILSHRWTAALTGLRTAGSLGSNQQIRSEFDIVYSGVIRPMQRVVLGKFINPILDVIGNFLGYDWGAIDLDIAKPMPISFLGDIVVSQVLTQDEMRRELGYEALPTATQINPLDNGNTN